MFGKPRKQRTKVDPLAHLSLPDEDEYYRYERPDPVSFQVDDQSDTPEDDVDYPPEPRAQKAEETRLDDLHRNPKEKGKFLYYCIKYWPWIFVEMFLPTILLLLNVGVSYLLIHASTYSIFSWSLGVLALNVYLFFRARWRFYHTFTAADDTSIYTIRMRSLIWCTFMKRTSYFYMNMTSPSLTQDVLQHAFFENVGNFTVQFVTPVTIAKKKRDAWTFRYLKHGDFLSNIVKIRLHSNRS